MFERVALGVLLFAGYNHVLWRVQVPPAQDDEFARRARERRARVPSLRVLDALGVLPLDSMHYGRPPKWPEGAFEVLAVPWAATLLPFTVALSVALDPRVRRDDE